MGFVPKKYLLANFTTATEMTGLKFVIKQVER